MRNGILLAAVAFWTCGCAGEIEGRKSVYPVLGKVTLGGSAPIGGATISFSPQDGQPVAIGKTGDDGTFRMTTYEWEDGAAEGTFNVFITKTIASSTPGNADEQHSAMKAGGPPPAHDAKKKKKGDDKGSMINAKYSKATGGLMAKVTASGPNEFTFDLEP